MNQSSYPTEPPKSYRYTGLKTAVQFRILFTNFCLKNGETLKSFFVHFQKLDFCTRQRMHLDTYAYAPITQLSHNCHTISHVTIYIPETLWNLSKLHGICPENTFAYEKHPHLVSIFNNYFTKFLVHYSTNFTHLWNLCEIPSTLAYRPAYIYVFKKWLLKNLIEKYK